MAVELLKSADFDTKVLQAKGTVLIDMFAEWCGPCKMLSPIVDQVAEERKDVAVYKVNVDEERSLAVNYRVMSIPTLLVFKDGELVKTSTGLISKEQVEELL